METQGQKAQHLWEAYKKAQEKYEEDVIFQNDTAESYAAYQSARKEAMSFMETMPSQGRFSQLPNWERPY